MKPQAIKVSLAALCGIVAAIALVLVLAASAEANPRIGFNDEYHRLYAAGFAEADAVRFPISSDFLSARVAVDQALAAGVEPIVAPVGWDGFAAVDTRAEYADYMAGVAAALPGATIQLWNEPNIRGKAEYGAAARPGPPLTAERAGAFARRAARAIGPGVRLLGPAIAPVGGWEGYLRRTYREIPPRLGVEVALNLYPGPNRPLRRLRSAYDLAARFGEVAVTELDPSPPWQGRPDVGDEVKRRAVRLLDRRGAEMVLFNDVVRFAPLVAALRGEWR